MGRTGVLVPRAWQVVDGAVVLGGVAVLVGALVAWSEAGHPLGWPALSVPVVVLVSAFPLVIMRPHGDIEVGFDAAVLVFLGLVCPVTEALVLWSAGTVAAQLLAPKRWSTRAFNAGLVVLVGWLALQVMDAAGPLGQTSLHELLAVGAGCALYFVVDVLVTGVSISLDTRVSLGRTVRDPNLLVSLVCFLGVDSLGYLAALVVRDRPAWALLLLVAPVATMLVAAGAVARASQHQIRSAGMFDAAKEAQSADEPSDITDALLEQARRVLRTPAVHLRDAGPHSGQIGVELPAGQVRHRWLVAERRASRNYGADDQKALVGLANVAAEALERLRLHGQMQHMATSDPLTGLANRTLFRDRVEHALELQRRHHRPLAVLFCDLDRFKTVNDRFGHDAGDQVLLAMAERLRACVRPADTVARLGGDEFAVLLEELTDPSGAEEVSERILAATASAFRVAGHDVPVGVSIGIAAAGPDDDAGALLRNADLAMYQAKKLGKGRYERFHPGIGLQSTARIELTEQLREALARHELRVYYQPVVDLLDGSVDGLEALLRWQHPVHGLVGPLTFIEVAEEAGLIGDIGEWVLGQAHADVRELGLDVGRRLTVSVNISSRQLGGRLVGQVGRLVQVPDAPQLVLELTESLLVGDDPDTLATLEALRAHSVRLAIDDFGTGYSSIGYLRRLPVDILKIDRSFVRDVATDTKAAALVEAIVAMSRSLDLTVLAEGIEDVAQEAQLRAVGCCYGQGFRFGQPMPAGEVRELLRAGPVEIAGSVVGLRR